ncbi:hypothetical protein ACQJBY_036470 [Aegilops geniculata]
MKVQLAVHRQHQRFRCAGWAMASTPSGKTKGEAHEIPPSLAVQQVGVLPRHANTHWCIAPPGLRYVQVEENIHGKSNEKQVAGPWSTLLPPSLLAGSYLDCTGQ